MNRDMYTNVLGPQDWSMMTVMYPDENNSVIVSNSWHQKRVRVPLPQFVEELLGDDLSHKVIRQLEGLGFTSDTSMSADEQRLIERWLERGWGPSLEYLLWSRVSQYADEDQPDVRAEIVKEYQKRDGAPPTRVRSGGEYIPLGPFLELPSDVSVGEIYMRRRTVRKYADRLVSLKMLSSVLWHGFERLRGCRKIEVDGGDLVQLFRSYGSAFDVYVMIYGVDSLGPGVYVYEPVGHSLKLVRAGEFRQEMFDILCGQGAPKTASWTIFLVANFPQYQWRYRHERALRNLYIEAGRIGHELILVGSSFGFGTFQTPAARDREAMELLALDKVCQAPVYSLTMGIDSRFIHE